MIGKTPSMVKLARFIARVGPTKSTVLIQGETGTGKELVARELHENSLHARGPFVAVNCAALTESLFESEMLGYEKGAFTGALAQKKGKFEQAEEGTLFLDEIGEINPAFHAKLLRVIDRREVDRIGGTRPVHVNIRLIAATNRDLAADVERGLFREDLYQRLKVFVVRTTALRDRRDDIPKLVQHFIRISAAQAGRDVRGISPEALTVLGNYYWPGNIRELEHAIEQAVVLCAGNVIEPADLPEDVFRTRRPKVYRKTVRETEREILEDALVRSGGHYRQAAHLAGMHPNCIHRSARRHNLTHLLR